MELSHEAALGIARQVGECGIPRVSPTGGEPLVRHDFIDIAHELAKRDVAITQLYTNGSLLTERVVDVLAELGQRPVVIMSFDGVGHHDWLRGTSGAEYDAAQPFVDQAVKAAEDLINDPKFQEKVQVMAIGIVADVVGKKIPGVGKVIKKVGPLFKK